MALDDPDLVPVVRAGNPANCAKCRAANGTGPSSHRQLSELDAMILEAVATGDASMRIAYRLHLSRQSVDYHVKGMQRQFAAANRLELVSRAFVAGALDVGEWPPRVPYCFVLGYRLN